MGSIPITRSISAAARPLPQGSGLSAAAGPHPPRTAPWPDAAETERIVSMNRFTPGPDAMAGGLIPAFSLFNNFSYTLPITI
ncbi:MAG: hypothetical protein OSA97_10560 [Nevskia sp.]|nr:hypothetical protein [Nevskia sp.]